jgi:predicted Zn-dependent peptidase
MQRPVLRVESEPQRQLLENGITLLTRALPEVYGIAVGVFVRTGTRDEPLATAGISHLLEHMVFKGTADRGAFELARDLEALGAQVDAYTTKEHTAYTLVVLPDQLREAVDILVSMLNASVFADDQLELEKQVVLEEIQSADDNPEDFAHERFCEALWPEHVLRHPILGTESSVASMGIQSLVDWCGRVHRGSNLIVAAAGAIGPVEEQILRESFPFEAGETPLSDLAVASPAPGLHHHHRDGLSQQYLEIGIPGVNVHSEDRFGLSLLANLLGGGMSSRLFQRVREERGLAYSIFSYTDFFRDTGMIATSFSCTPDKCQQALDVVAEEYRRLQEGDLDDAEVQLNKSQILSSVILGMEGTSKQMARLGRSEMVYGRFVHVREVLDAVEAINRDSLQSLAKRYLDPSLQTVVSCGPPGRPDLAWPHY